MIHAIQGNEYMFVIVLIVKSIIATQNKFVTPKILKKKRGGTRKTVNRNFLQREPANSNVILEDGQNFGFLNMKCF